MCLRFEVARPCRRAARKRLPHSMDGPALSVVVFDVVLPKVDGFTRWQQVRRTAQRHDTALVARTGYPLDVSARRRLSDLGGPPCFRNRYQRIQAEYREMPCLNLSLPQAARLWNVPRSRMRMRCQAFKRSSMLNGASSNLHRVTRGHETRRTRQKNLPFVGTSSSGRNLFQPSRS